MALTLGDNFSYQGAKPLDGRLSYTTLADMKAVGDATMYNGCLAYCVETDKTYQWKSTNTVDASTGKWREFESGGSGGTTDYDDLVNKPTIENVTLSGNKTAGDLGLQKSTLANAITLEGNEVTNLESALSILARLATISKITDNSLGSNSSTNFNKESYASTGNFRAYSYKRDAGVSVPYTTGVPQWFTLPSYDVYYLLLTFRGTDDTFIDEFAWCFYTESSVAKVRHYARRATKSGSTWTFPAWTEVGSLPVATSSVLGGVKIGENMTIEDGVINPSYLVVANKFNKADLYSTTEKVVGCWTDGRPIYQKTFQPSMPQCVTDGTGVATTISVGASVNEYVKISMKFRSPSGYDMTQESFVNSTIGMVTSVSSLPTGANYYGTRIYASPNSVSTSSDRNKVFLVNSATTMNGYTPIITVQYTKTTDSANSFKYADENDYSTSEKIVGTWIDGKPLYQKTIDLHTTAISTGRNDINLYSYIGSVDKCWLDFTMSSVRENSVYISSTYAGWQEDVTWSNYMAFSMFIYIDGTTAHLIAQKSKSVATTHWGYVTVRYTKAS